MADGLYKVGMKEKLKSTFARTIRPLSTNPQYIPDPRMAPVSPAAKMLDDNFVRTLTSADLAAIRDIVLDRETDVLLDHASELSADELGLLKHLHDEALEANTKLRKWVARLTTRFTYPD